MDQVTGQAFKPTTGELHEAGVKFQPNGFNAFVQVSVFDLVQQNVLTLAPGGIGRTQTGEIRSRGIEIEGKASLSERLDLIANFTALDPEVTKSNDIDLGKVPTNIPRRMAGIWADYTIHDGALNGLGFALGVRYVGMTYADLANTIEVPSYTITDAAIHYDLAKLDPRLKGAKLAVNVSNLFDKTYVSQCTTLFGTTADTNCVYGLQRTVLGTLRYRW